MYQLKPAIPLHALQLAKVLQQRLQILVAVQGRSHQPQVDGAKAPEVFEIFFFDVFNNHVLVRLELQQLEQEAKERRWLVERAVHTADVRQLARRVKQRGGVQREARLFPEHCIVNPFPDDGFNLARVYLEGKERKGGGVGESVINNYICVRMDALPPISVPRQHCARRFCTHPYTVWTRAHVEVARQPCVRSFLGKRTTHPHSMVYTIIEVQLQTDAGYHRFVGSNMCCNLSRVSRVAGCQEQLGLRGPQSCSAIEYFIIRYFKSKLLQLRIYIFVDSPGAGDPAPSRRWHISASETATSHGTGLRFIEYMYVFLLFFLFEDQLELSQAISISSILRLFLSSL